MIAFIIAFSFVILFKTKFSGKGFHKDYISIDKSNSVKGIFALIIVFSHMKQYIENSGAWYDSSFFLILGRIGQLMVVMFLFYSGYGLMESLKHKENYIHTFPEKRIFKTWFNFAVAVSFYVILGFILDKNYSFIRIIQTYLGWGSIGNSNWFIFDILVVYIFIYCSFIFFKKNRAAAIVGVTVLTMILIILLRKYREPYWYNTILTLPLGMWYSYFKEKIEKLLFSHQILYWLCLIGSVASFGTLYYIYLNIKLGNYAQPLYIIMACIFALAVVLISMKISFDNKILRWLGINTFSIYIIQRIPMILLDNFGVSKNVYLFSVLSVILALLCAAGFTKLLDILDKRLLSK